jgi:hypothetical protein
MLLSNAQACHLPPAETAVAVLMPVTLIAVLYQPKLPLPSWPKLPAPQHLIAPLLSTAQVLDSPAETALAVLTPLTVTGVLLLVLPPLPNCW